jgi:hypothetical protein
MLDLPTRTIQTQSAPENAGTKHLDGVPALLICRKEWLDYARMRLRVPMGIVRKTNVRSFEQAFLGRELINVVGRTTYQSPLCSESDRQQPQCNKS